MDINNTAKLRVALCKPGGSETRLPKALRLPTHARQAMHVTQSGVRALCAHGALPPCHAPPDAGRGHGGEHTFLAETTSTPTSAWEAPEIMLGT